MVPPAGLEPARQWPRILSPLCLPIPSRRRCLASPEGFEPPTHGLEGRCPIQLS